MNRRGNNSGWKPRNDHNKVSSMVDTSASKGNSSCTDGSPSHGKTTPENAGNNRGEVSEDSAGKKQWSNSEGHQHIRDLTDSSVPEARYGGGGQDGFSIRYPSARRGQGWGSNNRDPVKGSAENERPSNAKTCQNLKVTSSLLSSSSSIPTGVSKSKGSVRVIEEENLSSTGSHQNSPETPENKLPGGCSPEASASPSVPVRLDICKVKSVVGVALKPSVFAKNREIRKASVQKAPEILRPGMVLLKNHINHADQVKIIKVCRDLGMGDGGFYKPCFESGAQMNLQMMCLGMDWDPEKKVYGSRRSVDDAVPPSIPDVFKQIVERAVTESHTLIKEKHKRCNPEDVIPSMQPDICIINFYSNTGKLGLHQDKDESKGSLDKGLPVVSISIGDSAKFLYGEHGDVGRATEVVLESGDVLIFGGKSRNIFHGVTSILPGTAPKALVADADLRPGRLNLTFRKY